MVLLAKTFGCVRFVWNAFVESFNKKETPKTTAILRNEIEWLKEISATAIQQKARDFKEFKNQFFSKNRKKKIGKPLFKKKFQKQSYRLTNQKFDIDFEKSKIRLEKIGWIKIVVDREISEDSKYLSVTISKDKVGDYYVSILVETEIAILPGVNRVVGVDLGIKDLVTTSDGLQIKMFDESENQTRIKHLSRHLSRKKIGSLRFNKVKRKIAKVHRKITRKREWLQHNISSFLVKNYDEIVMEDLNVEGMLKRHSLAGAISLQGWSTLVKQVSYKSRWYGRKFNQVDRYFPSSKKCCKCGVIKSDLQLSDRVYICDCGNKINRDLNASINIKSEGVSADKRSLMGCETFNCKEQFLQLKAIPNEMINFYESDISFL
jgi:putative transposase